MEDEKIDMGILYPDDLYSFFRRPLFIIVDSTQSFVFSNVPKEVPFLVMMAPSESLLTSSTVQKGSVFTLFLTVPVLAFCSLTNTTQLSNQQHEQLIVEMEKIEGFSG